jgi:hypothetical protein
MKRQAKNLKVLFVIEDNAYGSTILHEHTVSVDSSDGYEKFSTSVMMAQRSIDNACSVIHNMHPSQIMMLFTEKVSALEAREQEAAKHRAGGDVWQIQNQNNELVSENACLKKQVKDLIEQLSDNISRGK